MKTLRQNWLFAIFTALFVIGLVQTGYAAEKKERKLLPALEAPAGSAGKEQNAAGIASYNKKDWKEAEKYFREAVKSDDKMAEARYNLGLALDKTGRHKEAGQELDLAAKLAPTNTAITGSPAVKHHAARMRKMDHDKMPGQDKTKG